MNLLVTGAFTNDEAVLEKIKEQGFSIVFMQNESDSLPEGAYECEGVVCNGLFLYHNIENFKALKFIQLTSAGLDRVPLDYINAHGIKIWNARGVYSVPMAEFALFSVLSLYKQGAFFSENQKAHKFLKHRGLLEVCGKTVAVVGCGSVGTECAKRFRALGCRVLGVDIAPYESEVFEKIEPLLDLNSVLASADIAILTLPLTEETYHLFDKERLSHLKKGAVLVNIARGGVVDTSALCSALQENLGGAALDVFEEEPLSENSPLWDMENVLITPHNSFVGEGNKQRLLSLVLENLRSFYEV